MFETSVLVVLEKVLSQYITDVLTNRQTERTRAEVIEAVKVEISRIGTTEKQVDAFTVAVRELDNIVRDDKYLHWQHDVLSVEPTGREIRRNQRSIKASITQLHESIERRRRELAQPNPQEWEDTEDVRLVEVDRENPDDTLDTPQDLTSWQERIMSLQSEVRKERRQAKDK
jgi:hypothetical protein